MEQITELERRITAALDRLVLGVDRLAAPVAAADPDEIARLTEELAAEREAAIVAAQTAEKLRLSRERDLLDQAELAAEVDRLTRLLDQQGLELHRMRNHVVQLREHLRLTREAAMVGVVDPLQINRALEAEVQALGAARTAEIAELDELLSELDPFVRAAETVTGGDDGDMELPEDPSENPSEKGAMDA